MKKRTSAKAEREKRAQLSRKAAKENAPALAKVNDQQDALVYDQKMRSMLKEDESRWHSIGETAFIVETRKLYRLLNNPEGKPFTSFESWLKDCAPGESSRATAFVSKRIYAAIKDIPEEERKKLKRQNADVLSRLSAQTKRDPKVLKAAQTESESKFRQTVAREHPEEHIEEKSRINLKPEKSQREVIGEALKVMGWILESTSREECLEAICQEWLNSYCSRQEYSHLSNQRAYDVHHDRHDTFC